MLATSLLPKLVSLTFGLNQYIILNILYYDDSIIYIFNVDLLELGTHTSSRLSITEPALTALLFFGSSL